MSPTGRAYGTCRLGSSNAPARGLPRPVPPVLLSGCSRCSCCSGLASLVAAPGAWLKPAFCHGQHLLQAAVRCTHQDSDCGAAESMRGCVLCTTATFPAQLASLDASLRGTCCCLLRQCDKPVPGILLQSLRMDEAGRRAWLTRLGCSISALARLPLGQ